ncbi:type II toxin-antitoxin system RelE/ParE family toxin [Pseudacidovorax sp.]|uniref:type II toxin-antitoxin system RelE/ParE family toxin n=1 Tax=Pseudacidovorax sp. TaxID=1934311 RepID=UPI0025DEB858|nr:type II toxin-antitoxin system RelE/ParE family toxin [Pseudacidovorax sp.]
MRVEQTDEYREWIGDLKDVVGRARILMRVDRLIHGNPGTHRHLTGGVSELKIDVGPGYRVYYCQRGDRLLLLLAGGAGLPEPGHRHRAPTGEGLRRVSA